MKPDVLQSIRTLVAERDQLAKALADTQARIEAIDEELNAVREVLEPEDAARRVVVQSQGRTVVLSRRNGEMGDREQRLVAFLKVHHPTATRVIAEHLGLNKQTAFDWLCDLRARKLIASSGAKKGLRWHLPKESLQRATAQ